jgi:hypothetical protein
VIEKKTNAASVDAAEPDAPAVEPSNTTPALTVPHATAPAATPFSELLRTARAIKAAIKEWRRSELEQLDSKKRRDLLHCQLQYHRHPGQRRADDRCTIERASLVIASQGTEKWLTDPSMLARRIASMMITSIKTKKLTVYSAGEQVPVSPDDAEREGREPEPDAIWLTREAYWYDLNNWLAANLPDVHFKFESPERDAPTAANAGAPAADPPNATPASANEPVSEQQMVSAARGGASTGVDEPPADATTGSNAATDDTANDVAPWKAALRDLGLTYIEQQVAEGLYPTQKDVSHHLEEESREQDKMHGPRGPLKASTIEKEVIRMDGWWAVNKPTMTRKKPGKPGIPKKV